MVELSDLSKEERAQAVYGIEKKEMYRDKHGKLRFNPPMQLNKFRVEAKHNLENILVSIKAKNKVTTKNINITKKKGGTNNKIQLTPRGPLHKETIYGCSKRCVTKLEKVNGSFDIDKIKTVAKTAYRDALLERLRMFDNDPKKAFTGKNTLDKNPLWLDILWTRLRSG